MLADGDRKMREKGIQNVVVNTCMAGQRLPVEEVPKGQSFERRKKKTDRLKWIHCLVD